MRCPYVTPCLCAVFSPFGVTWWGLNTVSSSLHLARANMGQGLSPMASASSHGPPSLAVLLPTSFLGAFYCARDTMCQNGVLGYTATAPPAYVLTGGVELPLVSRPVPVLEAPGKAPESGSCPIWTLGAAALPQAS